MTTAHTALPEEVVETTARMLKCLGHPLRLRILDLLERENELTVSEVQEALGLEQAEHLANWFIQYAHTATDALMEE